MPDAPSFETIRWTVADGVITVHVEWGRKGIDPEEADAARAACLHPFWGGKRVPIE